MYSERGRYVIYVSIVFSMGLSRRRTALFMRALRTSSGVVPIITVDSSIAHNTPRKKREKIKKKVGMGEGSKTE